MRMSRAQGVVSVRFLTRSWARPVWILAVMVLFLGCAGGPASRGQPTDHTPDPGISSVDIATDTVAEQIGSLAHSSPTNVVILLSPLEPGNARADAVNRFLTRRIARSLASQPDVTLVTRDYASEVLSEIDFQTLRHWDEDDDPASIFDQDTVTAIGRFYGATHLLFVGVEYIPGYVELSPVLVAVENLSMTQFSELIPRTPAVSALLDAPDALDESATPTTSDAPSTTAPKPPPEGRAPTEQPARDQPRDVADDTRSGHSVELLAGGTVYAPYFSGGLSAAYVHQVSEGFALGGWLGVGADFERGDTAVNPLVGVKGVFGDRLDGFALALNLGIVPSIGFYLYGFLTNVSVLVFDDDPTVWVELGYSIPVD